jgi:hypothetical protein
MRYNITLCIILSFITSTTTQLCILLQLYRGSNGAIESILTESLTTFSLLAWLFDKFQSGDNNEPVAWVRFHLWVQALIGTFIKTLISACLILTENYEGLKIAYWVTSSGYFIAHLIAIANELTNISHLMIRLVSKHT